MTRILLEEFKILVGEFPNLFGELSKVEPKLWRSKMFQRGVHRPASKSSSAFWPAESNRPDKMSASIRSSHCWATKSSNHSEKRASSAGERLETTDSSSSTLMIRILSGGTIPRQPKVANARHNPGRSGARLKIKNPSRQACRDQSLRCRVCRCAARPAAESRCGS